MVWSSDKIVCFSFTWEIVPEQFILAQILPLKYYQSHCLQRLSAEQVPVVLARERSKDSYNFSIKLAEETTWVLSYTGRLLNSLFSSASCCFSLFSGTAFRFQQIHLPISFAPQIPLLIDLILISHLQLPPRDKCHMTPCGLWWSSNWGEVLTSLKWRGRLPLISVGSWFNTQTL